MSYEICCDLLVKKVIQSTVIQL